MDTALLIWNRVVSSIGIFTNIISDRNPKLTSALWTNLHQLFGTKLSFSTAFHSQTEGLAERMIQTLQDMVRQFCAYFLEFIHESTNHTPAILEKGWNLRLPHYSLRKDFFKLNPTASSFKKMIEKARKISVRWVEESFAYSKDKWHKSHSTSDFKVGDAVLVSTTNNNRINRCENLKYSFAGTFVIKALHGENSLKVELSEELGYKHLTFPVSLMNP
ncbi:hypothetical protein O181_009247 [Austropuccinia psidii MF-1]|uniref:Integrase catalytic domain-containing protein n=1 Tax=Austropuccinia psidii MF-1 TaxID=1389203 RepID=A0A9Q3BRD4_9BASI|nr:hypothetical protein [Austropuccinia psidii MF-1]